MCYLQDAILALKDSIRKTEEDLSVMINSLAVLERKSNTSVKKYTSMSQKEAIIAYLKEVKGYCTIKEITNALIEGGLETKADKLYSNINTILIRDNTLFKKENKRWSLI